MDQTPQEVIRSRIQELQALGDEKFHHAVRRSVLQPDDTTSRALRSSSLAARTMNAVEALITRVRLVSQRHTDSAGPPDLLDKLTSERELLQVVLDGLRAQRGNRPREAAASALAARELQRRHASEYVRLVQQARRQADGPGETL